MKGHPRLWRAAGEPLRRSQKIRMQRRSLGLTLAGPQISQQLRRTPMVGLQSHPASGGVEAQTVQNLRRVLKCCVLWVPSFFFTQKRKFKSVFLCFFIACHSFLMLFSVVPFLAPFFTFSFLFGITKLERWVFYFLLFLSFILLSHLMTATEKKKYWKAQKNSSDPFLCITASCPF